MHITILTGTSRTNSVSAQVAATLHRLLQAAASDPNDIMLVGTSDCIQSPATIPPWAADGADHVPSVWAATVAKTDRFVFVIPEYNHGYPGEWKLLMDTLYSEYADKEVFVAAVGGGDFAGARVMEHVLPVLVNFKFDVRPERLHINAKTVFTESGDVSETATERLAVFVDAVLS